MKFSRIALAITSVLSYAATVVGSDDAQADQKPIQVDSDFQPTKEKPFNFRIEYIVKGKQVTATSEIIEVLNGDTIALQYQFLNNEEEDCSIIGVGGKLISPVTGELKANITANQIGPLEASNNQTVTFIQNVGVDVPPDTYLLVPAVYIVFQKKFMVLGARNQLIQVEDPKISFFNPKLILSELALGASLIGIIYIVYAMFGKKYLKGILPASRNSIPANEKSKSSAKSTSSSVDSEWLPQTHLKVAARKSRKIK
ncbi:hypothetical protein FOA43_004756 [Brettanomyces nanus]|uniref:Increased recombination centers protein 22 n=1 Tax=Eeniella nana TaxID=13502 RepID=A0A875SBH0_EENNA|nr:uncharacterized protein FOA43_004756 [Brettanomyces nanus]QPG77345.1 hypothetical protein FOA43_004756 [Brettanomyces nanus]